LYVDAEQEVTACRRHHAAMPLRPPQPVAKMRDAGRKARQWADGARDKKSDFEADAGKGLLKIEGTNRECL
jgi:hypothetical protein